MPDPAYQRLTRDRLTQQFAVVVATRASLWLGSDHLLLVQHSGFTESYKRFYFRDIQAITIVESGRRAIWNAVFGVLVSICLIGFVVSAATPMNTIAMCVWSFFILLFLIPMVINNLRGTACNCRLRTAVQIENLASLSRVRQAHKVLDKIRPLIVASQGQLTGQEVSERMRAIAADQTPSPNLPSPGTPPILS
jgi:hypothetical protein